LKSNILHISILIFILVSEAVLTGLLPVSRGELFNALDVKSNHIWYLVGLYFLNYLGLDFFQSIKQFTVLKVALFYRTFRTKSTNVSLVQDKIKGIKNLNNYLPSNSPQRIQEDIKLSYVQRITVWSEYFVSGLILVQLLVLNIHQPLLVAGALAYAVVSVVIAMLFNPRLTRAEIDSQQAEASYRTKLVGNILDISGLAGANDASIKAARIRTEYLLFTKLQLGLVAVLPYIVLIPQLFSGAIDLGTVVRHQATFGLIVINAAVLIQLYPQWIQGRASEQRVQEITK
jgi:ABC-type uncharacterized transport system fused permease/ATPase subunit